MVKHIKIFFILFTSSLILSSCCCNEDDVDRSGFTIYGNSNYDGEFRVDGYYYRKNFESRSEQGIRPLYYFYEDGTRFVISVTDPLSTFQNDNLDCYYFEPYNIYRAPVGWGAFEIENNKLYSQGFSDRTGKCQQYQIFNSEAEILNDTTLIITRKQITFEKNG